MFSQLCGLEAYKIATLCCTQFAPESFEAMARPSPCSITLNIEKVRTMEINIYKNGEAEILKKDRKARSPMDIVAEHLRDLGQPHSSMDANGVTAFPETTPPGDNPSSSNIDCTSATKGTSASALDALTCDVKKELIPVPVHASEDQPCSKKQKVLNPYVNGRGVKFPGQTLPDNVPAEQQLFSSDELEAQGSELPKLLDAAEVPGDSNAHVETEKGNDSKDETEDTSNSSKSDDEQRSEKDNRTNDDDRTEPEDPVVDSGDAVLPSSTVGAAEAEAPSSVIGEKLEMLHDFSLSEQKRFINRRYIKQNDEVALARPQQAQQLKRMNKHLEILAFINKLNFIF